MAIKKAVPATSAQSSTAKKKTAEKKTTINKTTAKTAVKKTAVKKKAVPKKVVKKKTVAKKITVKNPKPTTGKKTKTLISSEERRMMVAVHAYYKWEQAGRPVNQDTQHWIDAENEIDAMFK